MEFTNLKRHLNRFHPEAVTTESVEPLGSIEPLPAIDNGMLCYFMLLLHL